MYIGIMYSMCAFGPVCGFLLGAYLLSHHVDTFTIDVAQMLIGENSDLNCFFCEKNFATASLVLRGRKDKKLHLSAYFTTKSSLEMYL